VSCAQTGISDLGLFRYWLAAAQRLVRGDSAERQGRCALTTNLPWPSGPAWNVPPQIAARWAMPRAPAPQPGYFWVQPQPVAAS